MTAFNCSGSIWRNLPSTLKRDGVINLELHEGVLLLRVGSVLQQRIQDLLDLQHAYGLTPAQDEEFRQYQELDDYLSLINRLSRNLVEESRRAA